MVKDMIKKSIYISYLILAACSFPVLADQNPDLAGFWSFDDHTDQLIIDDSGCGNFAYAANGMDLPKSLESGKYGKAVHLGRDIDYLGVIYKPDSSLANLNQDFTVAFWFKPDKMPQNGVIMTYGRQGLQWTIGLNDQNELSAGLKYADAARGIKVSLKGYSPDSFISVAVIFNQTKGPLAVFLNGKKKQSPPTEKFWKPFDTEGFLIGCRKRGATIPSDSYKGLLDELIVFNKPLNHTEIAALAKKSGRQLFNLTAVQAPEKPFFWNKIYNRHELGHRFARNLTVGGIGIDLSNLPDGLEIDDNIGLLINRGMKAQKIHAWPMPRYKLDHTRGFEAPNGDWIIMFAAGRNQYGTWDKERWHIKTNEMLIYRSKDRGDSWNGPEVAWKCDYSSSFIVPFIPAGSDRIYVFGTEPIPERRKMKEDGPIVYRYSDDDGYNWSKPVFIRPVNCPDYTGISGMLMCQTSNGTWLLGSHNNTGPLLDTPSGKLRSDQYILRSTDEGKSWTLLPSSPLVSYTEPFRRNEGRVINLSDGGALMFARTSEGHLWQTRSGDDGLTWSQPMPFPFTHPSAPPMLFHLSDGKTLLLLIHNRFTPQAIYSPYHQLDRNELWCCLSENDGKTWTQPKFLMANLVENVRRPNLSYTDMFAAGGKLNFIIAHLWEQTLRVSIKEEDIFTLPEIQQLKDRVAVKLRN